MCEYSSCRFGKEVLLFFVFCFEILTFEMNVILSFPSTLFFKRAANGRRDSKQFLSDSDDSQVFIERETVRVQHTQSILH